MRVDPQPHLARPLLVHALARDFDLLDVWKLPAKAEHEEDTFERFVGCMPMLRPDAASQQSALTRLLFGVRSLLLWALRVDDVPNRQTPIPGCSETSVRERMSASDRARFELPVPVQSAQSFLPVYATPNERLYEISNSIVHALLHLSWVAEEGSHRAYMAVYAYPHGWFGRGYMALISPFRHLIVYPALMKRIGRAWALAQRSSGAAPLPQT